jgi:ABC-type transport system involved in multi-copper enzyme maturation permease subunit
VWSQTAGYLIMTPIDERREREGKKGEAPKLEIVVPPEATPAGLAKVTDEDLTGFLRTQFSLFVGIPESAVTVNRVPGVAEPNYRFDVELKGATTARGWPQTLDIIFRQVSFGDDFKLGQTVYLIEDWLVGWVGGTATLVISVIITAFFIPNMLRKGSLDLLISKPIGRTQLLVYKYVGGLAFIFITTTVTVGLVWVGMSFRAGYWDPTFLLTIPSLVFSFAILYAVSVAVAVFTRSAIASILITIAFMFVLWGIGALKTVFDANKVIQVFRAPDWALTVVDVLHTALPRYKDLDRLTGKILKETNFAEGEARIAGVGLIEYPSWGMTIGVSLAFIALMLALSAWRLNKRDN